MVWWDILVGVPHTDLQKPRDCPDLDWEVLLGGNEDHRFMLWSKRQQTLQPWSIVNVKLHKELINRYSTTAKLRSFSHQEAGEHREEQWNFSTTYTLGFIVPIKWIMKSSLQ